MLFLIDFLDQKFGARICRISLICDLIITLSCFLGYLSSLRTRKITDERLTYGMEHPNEGLETTSIQIGLNTSLFVVQNETPSTLKNKASGQVNKEG